MKTTTPKTDDQMVLASGDGFKLSKSDRQIILAAFSGIDKLSEPLKAEFSRVQEDVQKVLASFPAEEEVLVAGADASTAFTSMTKLVTWSQNLMAAFKADAEKSNTEKLTALASVPVEADKVVATKVAAGELLKKEDVATKIADAIAAARTAIANEFRVAADRRTQLASLKINPADADLTGSDEDFKAKSDKAKARLEKVAGFGLPEDRMTQLAWGVPDAQFDDTVALLSAARAAAIAPPAKAATGGNPFIAPAPAVTSKTNLGAL